VFTLVVATLAARSKHAGQIIVPALDILQSVPILGSSPSPSPSS
jgi:NitT/TauT family transport system permease protein